MRLRLRLAVLMGLWGMGGVLGAAGEEGLLSALDANTEFDRIERAAFDYLWEQQDPRSGLVYNTSEPHAPASPTASGVALSAIPIGVERGWISRETGYQRASTVLRGLEKLTHVHGFFYHFLDASTGARTWQSEVSCIDSTIAFSGAMVIAEYFAGTDVARRANRLINRAEWSWFLDRQDTLKWGWRPGGGFEAARMEEFSESILAYLLAMGSSTASIPKACWDALRRPVSRYADDFPRMVYTPDGSLFAYLLPLAWFDLRDRHDAYLDYWTNAKTAIRANMRFCEDHRSQFRTYREGLWGVSAAIGPDGYRAYGALPARRVVHDGTVAPYVVAASIPFFPDRASETYRLMERLTPSLWTPYGLGDALNLDREFVCRETIALDQGLALLMIENMRTGLIWTLFMRHPVARRAMDAAGFTAGSLEEPLVPAIPQGNPNASISIPVMDHAVAIDGDLREWIQREAIELLPTQRRNVEFGFFDGPADASVLLYLGWTPETFYLAGILTDDELVARFHEREISRDDCLEVYWDLDRDGFRFDGNPRDVQVGIAPGGPQQPWQAWAWGSVQQRPEDVQVAVRAVGGRDLFELGIPMRLLPGLTVGTPVAFSVAYHDRDRDGEEGKLHWSVDTASIPGTILFGQMTLSGHEAAP